MCIETRQVVIPYDSTPAGSADYTATTVDLTFGPGIDEVCFDVPITDDQIMEATEDFQIEITSNDPNFQPTTNMTTTINIIDDDSKTALAKCHVYDVLKIIAIS